MTLVSLSGRITHLELIDALHAQNIFTAPPEKVVIQLADRAFFTCSAMAFLASWGRSVREQHGTTVEPTGNNDVRRYVARMGLLRILDSPFVEDFQRKPPSGEFLPLILVEDDVGAGHAVDSVCDLVLQQFDDPTPFLPALEWAVAEVTDNILIHAEAQNPGAVCAQFHRRGNLLEIAFVDSGRGLMASLSESRKIRSHGDAITQALERGVTRNPEIGQGNGLAGTRDIVAANAGKLDIWTGDVTHRLRPGKKPEFRTHHCVAGTGVCLHLRTDHPVDLSQTFIGGTGVSYLESEAERIENAGGVNIAAECSQTGSRLPARNLRRKLQALLPEIERTLVLDFAGVTRASSSFLDELLGRFVKALGEAEFQRRVQVLNLSPQLTRMANVVIRQRLHGLADNTDEPDEEE